MMKCISYNRAKVKRLKERQRSLVGLLSLILIVSSNKSYSSTCYGTSSSGYLTGGVELPRDGDNFTTYSDIARVAGRTYVHAEVRDIIIEAYEALIISHPEKVYKYAETGLKEGGKFSPHKTHQNGLSVDFMTPVINELGESVHLPTFPWNRFGYDIEFDASDQFKDLSIDYLALAAHIVELDKVARKRGYKLWRVIFAPELQAGLLATPYAEYIRENIQLSNKRSWVRHDEHYHVDFEIPCESRE
ncbi:MAG: penicillin-insensitive murein endopeptidase [Thalassolituus sp.]|jgi:penicillin-insensitive murein endopeptidase